MDKIKIVDLECFARHGVYEEENRLGQKFLVSAVLYTDTRRAGLSDELEASIDYGSVCHTIEGFMRENTFKLIEKVAEELAKKLLTLYELASKVTIEIKKPWAPIGLPLKSASVEITRSWHKAYIAIGSNMGDSRALMDEAVTKINSDIQNKVIKTSEYIITKPYGVTEQADFLNGCLLVETLMYPHELLDFLQRIELEAGRERIIHWGPRTLDLDIIFYDDEIIYDERLIVPHSDMKNRDFVLKPMAEIAPYYIHPIYKMTMLDMLKRLEDNDGLN